MDAFVLCVPACPAKTGVVERDDVRTVLFGVGGRFFEQPSFGKVVRVHEENVRARGGVEADVPGLAGPAVLLRTEDSESGVLFRVLLEDLRGAVRRAVVHAEDLEGAQGLPADAVKAFPQMTVLSVIDRDDHGDEWRKIHPEILSAIRNRT